jgi:hypothetical protein
MLKNKDTGMFEKELDMYKIQDFDNYITNIFAQKEDEDTYIYLKLTIDKEALDWEFYAIFEHYDINIFGDLKIEEEEDCYNPTWTIKMPYKSNREAMLEDLKGVLEIHTKEVKEVYETIKNKEEEYNKYTNEE